MAGSPLPSLFGRESEPLGSLFREIEKTFDDFSRRMPFGAATVGNGFLTPRIDVSESKDAVDITAELPGVDEKDVDVTLAEDVLTIRGEKKSERDEKDKDWHIVERSFGSFSRSIALPFEADASKIEAKFDKGVLRVHLPKSAESARKEKKIEIKKA
jgi:HSP20 family protein